MGKQEIIGKKAKIVCTTEQIKSIGIKDIIPGEIVEIIEFDVDHIVYGKCYKIYDGLGHYEWNYIMPLKLLEIQK